MVLQRCALGILVGNSIQVEPNREDALAQDVQIRKDEDDGRPRRGAILVDQDPRRDDVAAQIPVEHVAVLVEQHGHGEEIDPLVGSPGGHLGDDGRVQRLAELDLRGRLDGDAEVCHGGSVVLVVVRLEDGGGDGGVFVGAALKPLW